MTHEPHLCTATTRSGDPCRFMARRATGLCINHDPEYQEQQHANVRRATEAAIAARKLPPPVLEDLDLSTRAGVQAALEAVLRLEMQGKLPAHRVRNLIRGLAIAARNFDPPGRRPVEHPFSRILRYRYSLDHQLTNLPANLGDQS
jgi:hypothetical protein